MNATHYLIANMKDGSRMAFDFRKVQWTEANLTEAHKCDGSRMAQIVAEVSADVMCLKIASLFWTKA